MLGLLLVIAVTSSSSSTAASLFLVCLLGFELFLIFQAPMEHSIVTQLN